MPRISLNDLDNYKSGGDYAFLQLQDDGDVAKVRFYIETIDDVTPYVVHKITDKSGKSRYVNCLRTYDQPLDDCPFCVEALQNKELKPQVKLFLPVLDMTDNQVKLFERGRTFVKEIEGVIRRNAPLVSFPCEIERNGAKGSTDTTYKVYPLAGEKDNTLIKDLPETEDLIGGYILDMTIDEARDFLQTGVLPGSTNAKEENLPRRTRSNTTQQAEEPATRRRTASRF